MVHRQSHRNWTKHAALSAAVAAGRCAEAGLHDKAARLRRMAGEISALVD